MQITNSYHQLGGDFYKEQQPDKVKNPQLIAFNQKLATELDIKIGEDEKYLVDIFFISLATGPNSFIHGALEEELDPVKTKSPNKFCRAFDAEIYEP